MDNDGNEFQDQNCHVGGEESSKFSPVLHPYALSKFDFDDGLQERIRFDSLVENEVFLGIQSQEDNRWIEDYSQGNSVFNSSAPEPIVRSNNVWYEAASSESVEMLLKSVGQEETVAIVEESDAGHKVDCVTENMESHKEDDKTTDLMDSNHSLLSEKVADHGSGQIDVKGAPSPGVEIITHVKSDMLSPSAVDEPCGVDGAKDNHERQNSEENVCEAHTSLDIFPVNEMQNPSVSSMHTEDDDTMSQDTIGTTVSLDNRESVTRVVDVGVGSENCLLTDSGEEVKEEKATSTEAHVDDLALDETAPETTNEILKNLSCSSLDSQIVGSCPVEITVSKVDMPSSSPVVGSGSLNPAEEGDRDGDVCGSDINKSECDHARLSGIHKQFDENVQDSLHNVPEVDGKYMAHVDEDSTEKADISASADLKVCQTIEVTDGLEEEKALKQGSDCQLLSEPAVSNNQVSALLNKVSDSQGDGSSISFEVEHNIINSTCSLTPIQEGKLVLEKSEIGDDASGVDKGSGADDYVSPIVADLALNPNSLHHDHVLSSHGEYNPSPLNDASEMECDNNESLNLEKDVTHSLNGASSKVNDEAVFVSECDADTSIEPDITEETPSGAHLDLVAGQIEENPKIGEADSVEANLIPLKEETSQRAEKADHELEIVKTSAPISMKDLLQGADHSSPVVGTSNTASESKQKGLPMNMTSGHPSLVDEIPNTGILAGQAEQYHQVFDSSSHFGSATKQNDATASDTPANHGDTRKDCRLALSEVSDSAVPTPIISSSIALTKSNGEKDETVEKSLGTSFLLCGVEESTFKEASQSDVADADRSFTFEVHPSSGIVGDCGQDKQFFPTSQSPQSSKAPPSTSSVLPVEAETILEPSCVSSQETFLASPSVGPTKPGAAAEPSHGSSQALAPEIAPGGSTDTPARKRGRPPGKGPVKQSVRKRNSMEGTSLSRQSEGSKKKFSMSKTLAGTGQLQLEGVKLHGKFEQSGIVSYAGAPVVAPNLPDLNTSASPTASFRQPFSDIQQLQLRAQIFVYGHLIQGVAPEETCMTAAFGASDGGRSVWEPVWRARLEKLKRAKTNLSNSENPLQPRSGSNPPEQTLTRKDTLQNTVLPSPVGRASSMGTPSSIVNSVIPLSSPLWNVSTPFHGLQSTGIPRTNVFDYHQPLSPLYPFQTPPSRNLAENNSSWACHASFQAPWFNASQSSPSDGSAHLPITEAVKSTLTKELVPSVSSGSKPSFINTTVHHPGPSAPTEPYSQPDVKRTTLPSGQKTAEPKSRKRKKSVASDNLIQIPLLAQARTEPVRAPVPLFAQAQTGLTPAPAVSSRLATSVVVSTPSFFGSKGNDARVVSTTSPFYVSEQVKRAEPYTEQKSNLPQNTSIKSEEAKLQAENAAALATATISHSESMWDQLNKQKSLGLLPEVDTKLAYAAVAAAAAADVARAAAAAAQLALSAASQSKMMADEAWISNPASNNESSISNMGNRMGLSTMPSNFKVGDEGSCSSSILVAAKEVTKKRVEAASFASKRAENLDAIVKAAELAAAAVSQAGRIVAMGDPPSLAKLVEAGPEGYWKAPQVLPEHPNEDRSDIGSIQATPNVSGWNANEGPSKKKTKAADCSLSPLSKEVLKDSMGGTPSFFASGENDLRTLRNFGTSDFDKTIGVIPESESELRPTPVTAQNDYNKGIQSLKGTTIREGSNVEVKRDGNGFKEAWFSGNVLSMESGKAFVSYAASKSGDGLTQLKEWVALEGDSQTTPRIRISQPVIQFEGTKKRRRGGIGDRVWSIGDKVDAWMNECWREGVITDKNKIDGTTMTIHFPAEGETSVVRAWHLRPTLIWSDGEWIESSSSRQMDPLNKGDTPQEKRLKLGGSSIEQSKKDSLSRTFQFPGTERPEEQQLLPLSDNEKMFSVGNNIKKDSKLNAPRTVRSGLQKEGHRVVFGVPKPGKTKKFMEVSKHYGPGSSSNIDKSKDKYVKPRNDAKEKQQGSFMTKISKPGKAVSSFGRTLSQKDKYPSYAVPTKNEAKKSASTDGSESEQQKRNESGTVSSADGSGRGFVFSSSALSRNMFTSNARPERAKRGNRAPTVSRSIKEATDNLASRQIPENPEPRRSNRRIQPTSRLLEGLQSSLILAHDKGHRSQNRSTTKGK